MNSAGKNITVILDDDPTGTQTVHDIDVLTTWDCNTLVNQFKSDERAFYILTNSRALPSEAAHDLILNLCRNLKSASTLTNTAFNLILRSDSTLRGHFPTEPDAVESALGGYSRWLICPFFEEGGRITRNDIHYIREGGKTTPVAETPFARDASFGYSHSDLKKWVEAKTNGGIRSSEVGSLRHESILGEGEAYVMDKLRLPVKVWIANITSMRELEILTSACKKLEREGLTFLYRTAASFVQGYLGIGKKNLLSAGEMTDRLSSKSKRKGGLIVVGSYVPKTTQQLEFLFTIPGLYCIKLDIEAVLRGKEEIWNADVSQIDHRISNGETVVVFTCRKLITGKDPLNSLSRGKRISEAVVTIVRNITVRPHFFIAKGGITSSDVASKGLNVTKAKVIGQALPGVPVWLLGSESRFPGLPYIVFPGNVGEPRALETLVMQLLDPQH